MKNKANKAIFLDRDGTIIEDGGYAHKIEDFRLLPNVVEALCLLKDKFKFFIITNQSGIGRGYYTVEQFVEFNNHLVNELDKNGINIEETFFCPHKPEDNCDCRKPSAMFIKEAAKKYRLELKESYVIGDHPSDVEMGKNAGCKTIFVLTGHGKKHKDELKAEPDFVVRDLLEGAKWIVKDEQQENSKG